MSHSLSDSLVQPLAGHSRRRLSAGTDCLPTVFFRLKYTVGLPPTCYNIKPIYICLTDANVSLCFPVPSINYMYTTFVIEVIEFLFLTPPSGNYLRW